MQAVRESSAANMNIHLLMVDNATVPISRSIISIHNILTHCFIARLQRATWRMNATPLFSDVASSLYHPVPDPSSAVGSNLARRTGMFC